MNMSIELLLAIAAFGVVSSITPGPNNLMLMTSGANFGFKRTLSHWLGVDIGFAVMIVLVGLGVMQLFDLYPASYTILKWVSAAYLLYLAYAIATSTDGINANKSTAKPMTFMQAALFQWVNPKAWTMALSAITIYAPDQSLWAVVIVAAVFAVVNLPCTATWVVLGLKLQSWLNTAKRLKIFNYSMALLLVLSLAPAL